MHHLSWEQILVEPIIKNFLSKFSEAKLPRMKLSIFLTLNCSVSRNKLRKNFQLWQKQQKPQKYFINCPNLQQFDLFWLKELSFLIKRQLINYMTSNCKITQRSPPLFQSIWIGFESLLGRIFLKIYLSTKLIQLCLLGILMENMLPKLCCVVKLYVMGSSFYCR